MRVAIVGSGYVGCVTGVSLAAHGHHVVLVDAQPQVLAALRAGHAPFFEPGLDDALGHVLASGALSVTDQLHNAVRESELVFVCVGTPPAADSSIDLTQLLAATAQVLALPDDGQSRTLVVKSTVVPGTTSDCVLPAVQAAAARWSLAVNPEFLREGQAVTDGMAPDRIVIGPCDVTAEAALRELYSPFSAPLISVPPSTAELIKYTSNSLLATLISFSNEIANIAETLPGVAAEDVFHALHLDRRLEGPDGRPASIVSYLAPGCGFGGSCLPKDIAALSSLAVDRGVEPQILDAVARTNATRAGRLLDQAEARLGGLDGREVTVLGLAFKPDTDDMRASPAIPIVEGFLDRGAHVRVFDPAARQPAERLWRDRSSLLFASTEDDALRGADVAVLVTAWPAFRRITAARYRSLMRSPLVLDGRGIVAEAERAGIDYWTVGYGPPAPSSSVPLEAF